MYLATAISEGRRLRAQARLRELLRLRVCLGLLALAWCRAQADPVAETTAYAQGIFREAQARYRLEPANGQAAWEFGRACFELAECATNQAQRAEIARQGIAACRQATACASNSAPAHYYLGENLGQMARAKVLEALRLVSLMRREFDLASSLDDHLDNAGPDRNLGQLYRDAPSVISVGNRAQAEQHLRRAVTLAPDFPDNHLELIEGYLKWGERDKARRELNALEASWPAARAKLTGPAWAQSWADWERQLKEFKTKAGIPTDL
jgi:tetratricopeptide (TPR) repeat protein